VDAMSIHKLVEFTKSSDLTFQLRVRQLSNRTYADWLESGKADLAFGFIPHPSQTLRTRRLAAGEYVCICAPDHPRIQQRITMQQYLSESHIVFAPGERIVDAVEPTLRALKMSRKVAISVPFHGTVMWVVSHTSLIATVPKGFAEFYEDTHRLR